jgi:hypothetical protein
MLPTAANLVKFGRKGQPLANAGSPVSFARQGSAKRDFDLEARTSRTGLMGCRAGMLDDGAPPKSRLSRWRTSASHCESQKLRIKRKVARTIGGSFA